MDYATNLAIVKESIAELKPFLYHQSVAFFSSEQGSDVSLASGTLVLIGDRLFIATASHAVSATPGNEILVLSGEPCSYTSPHAPILNKGKYPGDDPDVGFLEFGTNATEHLKKAVCPLERLALRGVGRPLRPAILVGNPGAYVKTGEYIEPAASGPAQSAHIPTTIAYCTIPLMEDEWPSAPNPDPSKDIFLNYPNAPAETFETGEQIMLPNPRGMSGGGIWDQGFEDGMLWTNESARLIGIQSRWHAQMRYARAVQIVHWLRLIYAKESFGNKLTILPL